MSNTDFTAVRTWNKPRTKATVTLTLPDGSTEKAGGKRAARAAAVIVVEWGHGYWAGKGPGIYGLRGDLHAAQTEAHKLATATTMRHHHVVLDRTPAKLAIAVPVEETS